jgi:hypothetical protein
VAPAPPPAYSADQVKNIGTVASQLMGDDYAEVLTVGNSPEDLSGVKPEYGDTLVSAGMAVKGANGAYSISVKGRDFLQAAATGNVAAAKRAMTETKSPIFHPNTPPAAPAKNPKAPLPPPGPVITLPNGNTSQTTTIKVGTPKKVATLSEEAAPAAEQTSGGETNVDFMSSAEVSFDDIQRILRNAVNGQDSGGAAPLSGGYLSPSSSGMSKYYISDVYPAKFVYCECDGVGTWQRSYVIDWSNGAKVTMGEPVAVERQTIYRPLVKLSEFSLEVPAEADAQTQGLEMALFSETEEGDFIIRKGPIFEVGDYPDKKFSMNEDELELAIKKFVKPVQVDLEHMPTVLNGKLGEMFAVEITPDRKRAIGSVRLPKWLDTLLEDTGRKVSSTLNRADKTFAGLALVQHPRIADAALMSAFSAYEAGGAVVVTPPSDLQTQTQTQTQTDKEGVNPMATDVVNPPAAATETVDFAALQTQIAAMQTQIAEQNKLLETERGRTETVEAQLAQQKEERIHLEAVTFADGLVRANKLMPAGRDEVIFNYKQAARDDERHAGAEVLTAEFTAAGKLPQGQTSVSRLEAYRKLLDEVLIPHALTGELAEVIAAGGQVLYSAGSGQMGSNSGGNMAPDRKTKLTNMTQAGKNKKAGSARPTEPNAGGSYSASGVAVG